MNATKEYRSRPLRRTQLAIAILLVGTCFSAIASPSTPGTLGASLAIDPVSGIYQDAKKVVIEHLKQKERAAALTEATTGLPVLKDAEPTSGASILNLPSPQPTLPNVTIVDSKLIESGASMLNVRSTPTSTTPAASDPLAPRSINDKSNNRIIWSLRNASASSIASAGSTMLTRGGSELMSTAMNLVGIRYKWGGNSASEGFDCSGMVKHVYEKALGLVLPRTALEQAKSNQMNKVAKSDLQPGDLVFFNTLNRAFSHVGVYLGNGQFIHAPRKNSVIRVDELDNDYWTKRFNGARRPADQ